MKSLIARTVLLAALLAGASLLVAQSGEWTGVVRVTIQHREGIPPRYV
jgi:hypothetical protein